MRILSFIAAVCLAGPVAADCAGGDVRDLLSDEELSEIEGTAALVPNGEGLFWTATRDTDTLSIIGTMHLYDPRFRPIVTKLVPLVRDADYLLVEAGPEEEAMIGAAIENDPSLLFLDGGPPLSQRMPQDAFSNLTAALDARGVPADAAEYMQPWYLALTLALPTCTLADLAAGRGGLDAELIDAAESFDIPIRALEPWDTLFEVMSADPVEQQIEQLSLSLLPDPLTNAVHGTLLDMYFNEEIAEIWELNRVVARRVPGVTLQQVEDQFAAMNQDLIVDRNLNWMSVIAETTGSGDDLIVAVGAGHLPGREGLLRLLEDDGWTVTRGL